MEYVQERVATLHDFGDAAPDAPLDRTTVVVPMTGRDHASLAAERVLSTLGELGVRPLVALRTDEGTVGTVLDWLDSLPVDAEPLWCNAPGVEQRLADHGLDGSAGKGRDVWLALGVAAARSPYVVVHDADTTTYGSEHVPRLCFPLTREFSFVKGYYARVENRRMYGRLCRLFYEPVVAALDRHHDAPIVDYLGAFRYGLAGEFAVTDDCARQLRARRGWGLEVGTLGETFESAGFAGTAQVDLGVHEHDHRSVSGPDGLSDMVEEVSAALFRAVADAGVAVDFEEIRTSYRAIANRLVDQYAADAAFNGLEFDPAGEREQVATYEGAIGPPGPDERLPAWAETDLDPETVVEASRSALDGIDR